MIIAVLFRQSVVSLAGKYTFADIGVKFLGDFTASENVAYIFGAGGIAYGLRRKKLQESNIQRLGEQIKQYEKELDPQRSSSRLTVKGKTRKEDRP